MQSLASRPCGLNCSLIGGLNRSVRSLLGSGTWGNNVFIYWVLKCAMGGASGMTLMSGY